ncbi:chaperone modulator CbpM [Sphingobacterium lumbrici]|uniref:chaperone modulator CbpM n=1 Tax=Sphingobacterium lumbrici TaxID=2559600 RepID=UPI00112AF0B1|nr:chaperone modulator CbpM [Sphingobacterium lumbrici]
MERTLVKIIDVCRSCRIESTFVRDLHENGLIELVSVEEEEFIYEEQLTQLEQYSTWHYDLELNLQGIDVVQHLLNRIAQLQLELSRMKNHIT